MDHPSSDWKNLKANKLKQSKQQTKISDLHFRFDSLDGEADHFYCLFWEQLRTEVFLGLKKISRGADFLDKPYLSRSYNNRTKPPFGDFKLHDDLLDPHIGSTQEIEISNPSAGTTVLCHTPTLKVPVEIHIDPDWTPSHLSILFKKQINEVIQKAKSQREKLKADGHIFLDLKKTNPVKRFKRRLKALGHFRLYHCVRLSEDATRSYYGADAYSDEKTMKRAVRECFPQFAKLIR
jgi:hypothetical protein